MKLAIHVPKMAADMWDPDPAKLAWPVFLRRLTAITGNVLVQTAAGHWAGRHGYAAEPVYVAETVLSGAPFPTYINAWALLREYAHQLIAQGEESILIVQDNEPTIIK